MPSLTVRAVRGTPVEVPLNFVLGTSATAIRRAPLLLIDLETEEGISGRAYVFCYLRAAAPAILSLLGEVERIVQGDAVAPAELWAKLTRRFTLIGVAGDRAHGDVRLRHRVLGRACDCSRLCRSPLFSAQSCVQFPPTIVAVSV